MKPSGTGVLLSLVLPVLCITAVARACNPTFKQGQRVRWKKSPKCPVTTYEKNEGNLIDKLWCAEKRQAGRTKQLCLSPNKYVITMQLTNRHCDLTASAEAPVCQRSKITINRICTNRASVIIEGQTRALLCVTKSRTALQATTMSPCAVGNVLNRTDNTTKAYTFYHGQSVRFRMTVVNSLADRAPVKAKNRICRCLNGKWFKRKALSSSSGLGNATKYLCHVNDATRRLKDGRHRLFNPVNVSGLQAARKEPTETSARP